MSARSWRVQKFSSWKRRAIINRDIEHGGGLFVMRFSEKQSRYYDDTFKLKMQSWSILKWSDKHFRHFSALPGTLLWSNPRVPREKKTRNRSGNAFAIGTFSYRLILCIFTYWATFKLKFKFRKSRRRRFCTICTSIRPLITVWQQKLLNYWDIHEFRISVAKSSAL